MTIIPTFRPIIRRASCRGLGGCLLGAGLLLIASAHPGRAGSPAPAHLAVPVTQMSNASQPEPTAAPAVVPPTQTTPDPVTAVGFGWG